MEKGKAFLVAVVVALALLGLVSGYQGGKAAWADWTFVRQLRYAAAQQQAQRQAQQQQQQQQQLQARPPATPPATPPAAPAATPAAAPAPSAAK